MDMTEKNIIERTLPLNHSLIKRIFGETSYNSKSDAYGQVVYFDEINPKVITAKLVYIQNSDVEQQRFTSLLEEDLTFDECLLISTLYFAQPISCIQRLLSVKNESIEDCLEHILKSTKGSIIYTFQFEQLAQLVLDFSEGEAIKLRKAFNKRTLTINDGELDDENWRLFKRIVRDRCPLRIVYRPNYSGAKNLMLYARSIA